MLGTGTLRDAGSPPGPKRWGRRMSSDTTKDGQQAAERTAVPAWLWLLFIGGFALVFWQFVPKHKGPDPPPAPISRIWVLAPAGMVIVVVLALVAVPLIRSFDPGVRRAEKRAREGDLDGAIADLRDQIEEKGRPSTVSTRWAYFSCAGSAGMTPSPCFARRRSSDNSRVYAGRIWASPC